MKNTILFYVSYYDTLFKKRILSSGFIIDGNTIEDGLKYLIENKYNDFMKDIKVEYFKKDSYYIEDEIFLKLVERFK